MNTLSPPQHQPRREEETQLWGPGASPQPHEQGSAQASSCPSRALAPAIQVRPLTAPQQELLPELRGGGRRHREQTPTPWTLPTRGSRTLERISFEKWGVSHQGPSPPRQVTKTPPKKGCHPGQAACPGPAGENGADGLGAHQSAINSCSESWPSPGTSEDSATSSPRPQPRGHGNPTLGARRQ